MKKVLIKIYVCWFYLWTALIFLLLYPLFLWFLSKKKLYKKAHLLRRFWGRWLMLFGGLRPKTIYEMPIDTTKTYVVVANHSSYLDIISLSCQVPIHLNFIGKIALQKIPLFGIFFKTIDIPVDRRNAVHAAKAYMRAKEQLRLGSMSIAVFPEGGIKDSIPKLSPFKDGPFKMAVETGTSILPITIIDNWKRGPGNKIEGTPGKMRMFVHKPINVEGMNETDITKLRQQVFELIQEKLREYGVEG
ncbi:MAG: 1-acyl-sn-glycerol-3-phosphate acyltransferase [Flavobacteriaceae bacterium]|nr:1-acyl-sn-glycerol-3-phosphate acyltransferase [Flavobacteriaceae bacterium]